MLQPVPPSVVVLLGAGQARKCERLPQAVDRGVDTVAQERGVITFTGYELAFLRTGPDAAALLDASDLIVNGPFRAAEREHSRSLVGSKNQRFIHLTGRYASFDPSATTNTVEITFDESGRAALAGLLTRPQLRRLTRQRPD